MGLGEDARGGDGEGEGVAVHDAALGDVDLGDFARVHEEEVGSNAQRDHCPAHGQEGGVVDVQAVDLGDVREAHRPSDGFALDEGLERFALLGVELLGVVDAAGAEVVRKNAGRRYDRAGEGGDARFVDAGDVIEALVPELALVAQEVAQALAFGAVSLGSGRELGGEGSGGLAGVGGEGFEKAWGEGISVGEVAVAQGGDGEGGEVWEGHEGHDSGGWAGLPLLESGRASAQANRRDRRVS